MSSAVGRETPLRTPPPGLGFTTYFIVEGRLELKLVGGEHAGWWLQAMAYTYAWGAPPPPQQVSLSPATR